MPLVLVRSCSDPIGRSEPGLLAGIGHTLAATQEEAQGGAECEARGICYYVPHGIRPTQRRLDEFQRDAEGEG